jgi:outer membrane lipoprotein LolB
MRGSFLFRLHWVGWTLLLGLAGCASVPPAPVLPVATTAPAVFNLNGRIAVRYRDRSSSGAVRWQHTSAADAIALLSPLGQIVTEIKRDADGVTLLDSAHKTHHAASAEVLTEDLLGWRLPLSGLSYWVAGHAQPDAPFELVRDTEQRPAQLLQNGWRIDYTSWQDVAGQSLPRKLDLQREGMQIRLVIDKWSLPAP